MQNSTTHHKFKTMKIKQRLLSNIKTIAGLLLLMATFLACEKENQIEPELEVPKPKMENLDLGLGNSKIGVIGEDFHFEGDILAVDKIDTVVVEFLQKSGGTYSKPWKHKITWTQYKGLKNTNVHKHFNIPEDAAEGKYDLIITIYDENGSKLIINNDFEIFTRANLPIRPTVEALIMTKNGRIFYNAHVDGNKYPTDGFKLGDTLSTQVSFSFVKGDGKLFVLLIKKTANYNPKTIAEVDFDKAIVYDVFEHKGEPSIYRFSNYLYDPNPALKRDLPDLVIGAEKDNNTPQANVISGVKAWQTGEYNLVILYQNYTNNSSTYKSVPFSISN